MSVVSSVSHIIFLNFGGKMTSGWNVWIFLGTESLKSINIYFKKIRWLTELTTLMTDTQTDRVDCLARAKCISEDEWFTSGWHAKVNWTCKSATPCVLFQASRLAFTLPIGPFMPTDLSITSCLLEFLRFGDFHRSWLQNFRFSISLNYPCILDSWNKTKIQFYDEKHLFIVLCINS